MARTDPQMNIRLPAGLKAALEDEARRSGRSLNSEVVNRLQESLVSRRLQKQLDSAIASDSDLERIVVEAAEATVKVFHDRAKAAVAEPEDRRTLEALGRATLLLGGAGELDLRKILARSRSLGENEDSSDLGGPQNDPNNKKRGGEQ